MTKHIRTTATWEQPPSKRELKRRTKGSGSGRKSGLIDAGKLFRMYFCKECNAKTEHVYCESMNTSTVHMCYACSLCGTETEAIAV